jgi:hypothetical protein
MCVSHHHNNQQGGLELDLEPSRKVREEWPRAALVKLMVL